MKKILTVVTFALVMMFGVQSIQAQGLKQNEEKVEVVAKAKVAELTNDLGLNGDQQRSLFRALVQREVSYRRDINGKDANNATVKANKTKFDSNLDQTMKKVLTADQYKKWLSKQ